MQTAQAEATEKPELSVEIEEEQNTVAEEVSTKEEEKEAQPVCLLYTSPSPRDTLLSRMPSSA